MTGPPLRPVALIYPFIYGADIYVSDPMYQIGDVRAVLQLAPQDAPGHTLGADAEPVAGIERAN